MNIFIHKFSVSVNINAEECRRLYRYRWMPMSGTDKQKKCISSIIEFCDRGLQIHIKQRAEEEIKYDKVHNPFRMDLIVTPYKLLYPGANLGKLTGSAELIKALKVLDELVDSIEKDTGICIRCNYKIRRVDITCDVLTPSDDYSKEIIATTKVADLPYGYRMSVPTNEEVELYGWDRENGSLFNNLNQSIFAKVYNKKENLYGREEYSELDEKGLVRFEITLTRKFLRRKGLLNGDNLGKCLGAVMECSEELFEQYFVENLHSMPMFSLKVLYDYLDLKYKGKEKTLVKLKAFCKMAYKCKKEGIPFSAEYCQMSPKVFDGCYEKFENINVSPIPAELYCPYIPALENLLNEEVERNLFGYAQKKTRGKEVWFI